MKKIKLHQVSTHPPAKLKKENVKKKMVGLLKELDELQNLMYAEHKHSILVVVQGMDASGKDGLTRDVFTSMNPQGVNVASFKEPTDLEQSHDFLWRIHAQAPARGMIQIFNRSHYEDILITRVHGLVNDDMARKRMKAINDFEQMLTEQNNTTILKFYLHVSHEEQRKRLEERLEKPEKMWKYNAADFMESDKWNAYMKYYEDAITHCNTIPWHIVPADHNWYKSYVVASILRDTMKEFKMKYPGMKKTKRLNS